MRETTRGVLAAAIVLLTLAGRAAGVEFGEKAPDLDLTGWVQGAPIAIADGAGKTVFVLQFVATFKPETAKIVQDAAKFYDKHKDRGLEVIAITKETADEAKPWFAAHPVGFRVATDENHNTCAAFDVRYEPLAIVIDRSGAVVYEGRPGEAMEKTVLDVLSGKFDLKKALEIQKLRGELWEASRGEDPEQADQIAAKILDVDATDWEAFDRVCGSFERKKDLEGYRKYVRAHTDRVKTDGKALSAVAMRLVTDGRWDWRDPELALATAKRAVDATKSADADVLDTLAYVLAQLCLLEQAIEQEKKAVAVDAKDLSYKHKLAFYEQCLAAKQKGAPATPPAKKK